MAFLFCMTMVAGSFAATPQDVTKVSSSGHMYPMQIINLNDATCKVGKSVQVTGTLQQYILSWVNAIWRNMNLKITNDKGVVVYDKTQMNDGCTAQAAFKVDTAKLNLNPGKYTMTMSYAGNEKDHLNPCESTSTLTVTSK